MIVTLHGQERESWEMIVDFVVSRSGAMQAVMLLLLPLGWVVGTEPEQHQPRFLRCSFSAAFAAASASSLRETKHAFCQPQRDETTQTCFRRMSVSTTRASFLALALDPN